MMTSENRILVVVDPTVSGSQVCVDRAAWLAKNLDLEVELLICHYEQFTTSARAGHGAFVEKSRQWAVRENRKTLETLAQPLRDQSLSVIVSSVWERPLDDGIVRHVLRTNPRFVLKDTHYHGKLHRAIFTNTDWNLVLKCPVPVWLSKPHSWPSDPRIIASIDPAHEHDKDSSLDVAILNNANMIAENLHGELHAFHAHLPMSNRHFSSLDPIVVPLEDLQDGIEQDRKTSFNELLDRYSVPIDRAHLTSGDPSDLLPQLATDLNAGLVVMGAVARSKLENVFIGSTTERVLDRLPCDLLVVKPEWFRSSVKPALPDYYVGTREHLPDNRDVDEFGSRIDRIV